MQYATLEDAIEAENPTDCIKIRGFFRLQIEAETGEIIGDSGWNENVVVNDGFNDYLCKLVGAMAGSKQVSHMAIGTGGAPAVSATTLPGEVVKRAAVTAATSATSKTIQFTATFASANSFVTDTRNISNIALAHTSTAGAATIMAGNTFASSSVATNQNLNCSYSLVFA